MADAAKPELLQQKVSEDGYVQVYLPAHPDASDGYVQLHRLVMEAAVGGRLPRGAEVHHKDRNPRNNSLENLQLLPPELHKALHNAERRGVDGASIECDAWAASALDVLREHYTGARDHVPFEWNSAGGAAFLAEKARRSVDAVAIAVLQGKHDERIKKGVVARQAPATIAEALGVPVVVVTDRIRLMAGATPVVRKGR